MSVDDHQIQDSKNQWNPLSYSQQRLWLFQQLQPHSLAYNVGGVLWFEGEGVSAEKLNHALNSVIELFPSLRTQFSEVNGKPVQKILPFQQQHFEVCDYRNVPNATELVTEDAKQRWRTPFDLNQGQLARSCIYQTDESRFGLLLSTHHIVTDAWSLQIIIKALVDSVSGKERRVRPAQSYLDYSAQQAGDDSTEAFKQQAALWQQQHFIGPEVVALPSLMDQEQDAYTARHELYQLPECWDEGVKAFASNAGATKFEVLASAMLLTLRQYTSNIHPSICVPALNRNAKNRRTVGFYVNSAVVGFDVEANQSLAQVVSKSKAALKSALEFEHIPLEVLLGEQASPTMAINFRNHGDKLSIQAGDFECCFDEFPVLETPFELVLDVVNKGNAPLRFVYAKEKFTRPFIRKFIGSFVSNLTSICQTPDAHVASLSSLSEEDKEVVQDYSGTDHQWQYSSFTQLVTEQVNRTPDAIALKHQHSSVTYQELDSRSDCIAQFLLDQDLTDKSPIGVLMDRSVDMIVAMMAVLKSGSPFLPLDPDYPVERLSYMLQDSKAELVLCRSGSTERADIVLADVPAALSINIESIDALNSLDKASLPTPHPQDLAYIIYTSGSTGKPKGVTVSHQGLSMHVQTIGQRYGMTEKDVELHFASISFDGAVERWTVPLAFGSKLVIREQELWTAEQTCQVLQEEAVTIACFPPSYVGPLLDWIEQTQPVLSLRSITLGGEAFTRDTFERIQQVIKPPRIINGYGPTETVITPMIWEAYPNDTMDSAYAPIGTAVGERTLYVLDSELNRVPLGCSGELYIGSEVSLAQGYLERPDLTSERFIPDPFANNGERMYRTGDLVRWRDDGVMEYLGRVDQQVKIRGFRIELGEIESQLQALTKAEFCAVAVHESPTGKKLVGYVQSTEASGGEEITWLNQLSQLLPDYMVPTKIVVQEKLPLTPAGKIDRNQLEAPSWSEVSEALGEVTSAEQQVLAELWCELLKIDQVGSENHFFALGGDSIMALQLVGKLRQNGWLLAPKQVFDSPKLFAMAEQLTRAEFIQAEQSKLSGSAELLPIQTRFIEHYQLSACNQYVHFRWPFSSDFQILSNAFAKLVSHHDALRLVFTPSMAAKYGEQITYEIQEVGADSDLASIQHAIDLEKGISSSIGFRNLEQGSEVVISIHHLVVDALSWPVLVEDFAKLYQAELAQTAGELSAKTHHQNDWHKALTDLRLSEKQKAYWQHQTSPNLYPKVRSTPNKLQLSLPMLEVDALAQSGKRYARLTQEQSLYVSACLAVSSLNGNRAFTLHRESHGRYPQDSGLDLSRTVGWYTALYPQRVPQLDQLADFVKTLKDEFSADQVGGTTFNAGVAQGLWSHVEHMDVLFNYLGTAGQQLSSDIDVLGSGLWREPNSTADAAIVLNLSVNEDQLQCDIELDSACFDLAGGDEFVLAFRSSIERLTDFFTTQTPVLTRSDSPLANLTQSQLDVLFESQQAGLAQVLPKTLLPLSTLQQGLYFHAKLSESNDTYVNQITLPLHNVDAERMVDAWQKVMKRHQMLRSTVFTVEGSAYLAEWSDLELEYSLLDVRQRTSFDLQAHKQSLVQQGFTLEQTLEHGKVEPLWRVDLVQTGERELQCIFTIHHLLMDGWSTGVLLSDLFGYYQDLAVDSVKAEFSDYLTWVEGQDLEQANTYWKEYLAGVEAPTRLVEAYGSETTSSEGFVRFNDDVSVQELADWQSRLKQSGVTLNTLTQAAWLLTLQQFTGQQSPMFGNTVAGRPTQLAHSDSMVGLFINTLPITSSIDLAKPTEQWLLELQNASSEQREYSYSSLSDIQSQTGWAGENLFDTLVVFENYPLDETLLSGNGDFKIGEPESYEFTHYPLTLAILPSDSLRIVFAYDTSKFTPLQIERLAQANRHHLEQLVTNLSKPLSQVSSLAEAQLDVLARYQRNSEEWSFVPFTDLVGQQALTHPKAEALAAHVEANNGRDRVALNYQELVEQSDAIAQQLIQKGVKRDEIVGVLFERSCEMLVVMMGVMKAGGAFLPLDPSYPEDRLAYMLEDSSARFLVHDASSEGLAKSIQATTQRFGFDSFDLTVALTTSPAILPEQLAYVIYTSGSTGKPKGVCVSHHGLSMHVQTIGQRYGMTVDDVELHFASISFDGAIERWTVPLAFGSRLVIRDQSLWSAQQTCEVLEREHVTIACFPPSYVMPLLEWIEGASPDLNVRSWTLGGEAFTRETYFKLQQVLNPKRIINGYGPTETVVTPMIWEAYSDTGLESAYAPIGTSVGSRSLYVLDAQLNLVPPGVVGELYIGEEVGLARGYLERPNLTSERFLPDPFSKNGERMYRTGDLVKWREDGVMEYLGRSDEQVKIRGFRIELGEIESRIQTLSGSEQCAVIACDTTVGKQLVAYIQTDQGACDTDAVLRELALALPDYMVPSQLIALEKMPLTPASKVDKKRLPEPSWMVSSEQEYVAPVGALEIALANQWQAIFNIDKASRYDDFFALGGQSLLATQLVGRLKQQDNIRLSLQAVFDTPVLSDLAKRCEHEQKPVSEIEPVARLERMPASAVQKRLWFVQQLLPNSSAYHMPLGLAFKGNVDLEALKAAIESVTAQHEIFRTNFEQVDGELMQIINQRADVTLNVVEMPAENEAKERLRLELIAKPFDFANDALLRFDWMHGENQTSEGELLITAHHIVSDGVSMQLLLSEIAHRYNAQCGGELLADHAEGTSSLQYADYANWQQGWLLSEEAEDQKSWWLNALQHDIDPLVLHSEVARDNQETSGNRLHFDLTKQQISKIHAISAVHKTTPYNVMLVLWQLLMHKYSGNEQIRVGVPVAGRSQLATHNMQGCFINSMVIPAQIRADESFSELLSQVKRFNEQALQRQDYPFEMLVESLGITGNLQHHPLYQTSFNFQQFDQEALFDWSGLEVAAFDPGVVNAQLEISMDIQKLSDESWKGFISYVSPIFDEEVVQSMLKHWLQMLNEISENTNVLVSQIGLVDEQSALEIERFNKTELNWGEFLAPPVAIQEQALRTPDLIALSMQGESMTYAEFDEAVNRLANWLRKNGVNAETRVGLGLERSFELVIALHAITRAGGAYVPLDPSYPSERLNYILESADIELLLTDSKSSTLWPENGNCQYVDVSQLDVSSYSTVAPVVNWQEQQSLYVIFTSGSTGLPKGVVNTQSALQNRLNWMQAEYRLNTSDCVLQKTPFSFDVSVWEFFWPLMTGARLAIAPPDSHRQPSLLSTVIQQESVTTIHFVPSMLNAFSVETEIEQCQSLKRIICSGEALPADLVEQVLNQSHVEVHNLYGPTEAAIDVTYWQCELPIGKRIPIGNAISNTQLHVLDDNWNPVPIGVPGELYLAGDGLAREYLSRPDLTADRFVPNPWGASGSRMYRTGDQVVRMADGRLEYLGRLDNQVKIRGLRIELEEIENVINQLEWVEESAVIAFSHQTGDQLVAYIVDSTWDSEKEQQVKDHLAGHLPDYMVPSVLIGLASMPLSPNGKRDRKALPAPEWQSIEYRAPESELEVWFAKTWSEVLGIEKVGLDDNFFALGGHSLLATRVVAKAHQELGIEVVLKDFFDANSLQVLTDKLQPLYQTQNEQEQDEFDAMAALMDELELL
ncbi:amino acid adenylation domain-containing protein [Vibrio sp. T187]|uniref:non-ribosomal peptide synthetase n=1 Tax=Vibrio TaxID=662 RepID=UPI0010C953DD|nr:MULTISPECIES: non-ribosomal peptide synthetase [Vibrio]MBW3694979.1 amino acid adenylation domain-containing protein [Vibrio sp. T187]